MSCHHTMPYLLATCIANARYYNVRTTNVDHGLNLLLQSQSKDCTSVKFIQWRKGRSWSSHRIEKECCTPLTEVCSCIGSQLGFHLQDCSVALVLLLLGAWQDASQWVPHNPWMPDHYRSLEQPS